MFLISQHISQTVRCMPGPSGLLFNVERNTKTDRASVVAAAAAHEFNNELTVILSTVASSLEALESGYPARASLLELQDAAQRCARNSSGLLRFSKRPDTPVVRTSFEKLLGGD